jgi:hypothetical protein
VAGDWIKMRGALLDHPKVIAMTRALQETEEFRDWMTPGGGGPMNGKIVSDVASRAVTTALLLRAWSSAREHGKFEGDDLWLEHSWVEDLDQLAGAPGVGLAMESVGWVMCHPTKKGVILPNFKEFNVPMTEAERAKTYRDRKKGTVTIPSQQHRDENSEIVTTRVEKRRDITPIAPEGFIRFWDQYPGARRIGKGKCLTVWRSANLEPLASQIVAHVEAMRTSEPWQREGGRFIPSSITYLNQRRFEDGGPPQPSARRLVI